MFSKIFSSGICSITSEKLITSKKSWYFLRSSIEFINFTSGLKALKSEEACTEISYPNKFSFVVFFKSLINLPSPHPKSNNFSPKRF